jgi:hypothetical protein
MGRKPQSRVTYSVAMPDKLTMCSCSEHILALFFRAAVSKGALTSCSVDRNRAGWGYSAVYCLRMCLREGTCGCSSIGTRVARGHVLCFRKVRYHIQRPYICTVHVACHSTPLQNKHLYQERERGRPEGLDSTQRLTHREKYHATATRSIMSATVSQFHPSLHPPTALFWMTRLHSAA